MSMSARSLTTFWFSPGFPGVSPGLPFAVNQKVVKQKEDPFLDVACRDFEKISMKEQLCADIGQVGSLQEKK